MGCGSGCRLALGDAPLLILAALSTPLMPSILARSRPSWARFFVSRVKVVAVVWSSLLAKLIAAMLIFYSATSIVISRTSPTLSHAWT